MQKLIPQIIDIHSEHDEQDVVEHEMLRFMSLKERREVLLAAG